MSNTFLDIEGLKYYTETLLKSTNKRLTLEAINICPQCGAVIADNNECEYCGAKLKLVVEEGKP